MDKEKEFLAKLLVTFKLEVDEHLKTISAGLIALEGSLEETKKKEWIETIYREAHSLKGAARSVNHDSIQVICQSMENVLSAWKSGKIEASKFLFDTLYRVIDFVGKITMSPPKQLDEGDRDTQLNLIKQLDSILVPGEPEIKVEIKEKQPNVLSTDEPILPIDKTIRISVNKLDKLFQQVEELLALKMTLRQEVNELNNIQKELRNWDKKWDRLQKDLKKRNTALDISEKYWEFSQFVRGGINHLTKITSQDYRFIGNMVDTLLEDTKKALTQPFSTLFDILPRMVRDLANTLGKEIHLEIRGGEIEIDRRILEELKDPLIHLIRNSIDHGIENPQERVVKHKPPYGTITITASQVSGSNIQLDVNDDGKGIDLENVRELAVKNGYISKEESLRLTEQETLGLIFYSGISTSSKVTELSGRGLGMGIVSEKVEKLGGQVKIETKKDVGSIFKLTLPITLATFRGVHIKVLERDFIFPIQYLKHVILIGSNEIKTVENQMMLAVEGKLLPFVHLGKLLNLPNQKSTLDHQIYVMIIKASEKTIALGIDQVISEQEILVKGLGRQLVHVKNILAATILEGGKIVPVLHPLDLVHHFS